MPPRGGTPLYGLNGVVRPDEVLFLTFFCLKRGINFTTFCLNKVSLHLNLEKRALKIYENCTKNRIFPFLVGADV